jgi:hypothetical protein
MADPNRRGFKDPTAAVQRLTPIAQAERACLAATRTASGSNPFGTSMGFTTSNPNLDRPPFIPNNTSKGKVKPPLPDDRPSSDNWRSTAHPPPPKGDRPANSSDIGLLIAELKAQRDEDRARRDQDAYRIRCKAELEEQTRITSIVAAVAKRFKDDNILKPDGSNLRQWERALRVHASERFGHPDYFSADKDLVRDPSDEQIARGIIHSSVNSDLTYDLLDLASSGKVFDHLMMKFQIMNRAAQIQAWLDFIHLDPEKHTNTANLSAAFNNLGKTFAEQGVNLTWDNMLELIIQSNLKEPLRRPVDQKVDLYMETHNYEIPLAQDMLQLWTQSGPRSV